LGAEDGSGWYIGIGRIEFGMVKKSRILPAFSLL